jgi:hypothetical protein
VASKNNTNSYPDDAGGNNIRHSGTATTRTATMMTSSNVQGISGTSTSTRVYDINLVNPFWVLDSIVNYSVMPLEDQAKLYYVPSS